MKKKMFFILIYFAAMLFLLPEMIGPKDATYAGSKFAWNLTFNFPLTLTAFVLSLLSIILFRNTLLWQRVIAVIVFIPILLKVILYMVFLISILMSNKNNEGQFNSGVNYSGGNEYWDSIQKQPRREISKEEWDKIYENSP